MPSIFSSKQITHVPKLRWLPVIFVLALVLGCDNPDSIRVYTVPKHELIQIPIDVPDANGPVVPPFANRTAQNSGKLRLLAALVVKGKTIWSVKAMTNPVDFPQDIADKFDQLIQTFDFADIKNPKWELPEGWSQQPGGGMRFATLALGELEFSVISSVAPSADRTRSILENINRWRGQVRLSDVEESDLDEVVRRIKTSDGQEALMIDLRSPEQAPDKVIAAQEAQAGPASPSGPVSGTIPPSWESQKPGMMQLLSYSITSETGSAIVTVSQAGGPVFANVDRWRGQVGLPRMKDESELDTEATKIDGQPALIVELFGKGDSSMAVAMVPASSPRWFFKLMGDTEVVKEQMPAFREYLTTVSIQK